MIAHDTSVLVAMLDEPEAEAYKAVLRQEPAILIGWPTLFETRTVLTAKQFSNAGDIVNRFYNAPNITAVAFDAKHYQAAEIALERYGKGRHPASPNGRSSTSQPSPVNVLKTRSGCGLWCAS